jgi:hypothetical protein
MNDHNHNPRLQFRAGDFVEVRSKEEILATLDDNGTITGLPFMPEMLQHCGKIFRVYKRADKACDTIAKTGSRRMEDAVLLEGVRCDGAAHGGCQAGCLIFWKEAWLRPVQNSANKPSLDSQNKYLKTRCGAQAQRGMTSCTEDALTEATLKGSDEKDRGPRYSCQTTELRKATRYLAWWDIRQYIRDLKSRNITARELLRGASIAMFNMAVRNTWRWVFVVKSASLVHGFIDAESSDLSTVAICASHGLSTKPSRLKNTVKALFTSRWVEYPHIQGRLKQTPSAVLNLQPGELVQVKSHKEIAETLDINNKNRGLQFDIEMVPYCGGTYRVLRRVEKIIDERSGRMLTLPNDCIILEGVVCKACFSDKRLFCPRSIYSYWREIWLKRVDTPQSQIKPNSAEIASCH